MHQAGDGRSVKPSVLRRHASERGAVAQAARLLRKGGLVAFPTETVYGLGVRVGDRAARRRLAAAKGRPGGKPFQILVSSARRAARLCPNMPPAALRLARAFWPGPLTLVLSGARSRWIGLRVPDHPVALDLIARAGGVIVATSANRSGHPPACSAGAVLRDFAGRIDLLLDGGPARGRKASTVVRVVGDNVHILRVGAIPERRIVRAAGVPPQ